MRYVILCFGVVLYGCTTSTPPSFSETYIRQALDSIAIYSIDRDRYNLDSLEAIVVQSTPDSATLPEIHEQLENAIRIIDPHSYLIPHETYKRMEAGDPALLESAYPFIGKMLEGRYALVSLDGFSGVDSVSSDRYADSLQRVLNGLYNQHPKGWIIDLRKNSGGWIYPMLAGLGPLLGEGVKAHEVSVTGEVTDYYYMKYDSLADTLDYLLISDSAYVFEQVLPTVVLIGPETGSAGELLTLAFRGNPKTILMGKPTYGASTDVHGFFMPDSAWVCVAHGIMTDRYKIGDGGSIQPEVMEEDPVQLFEQAIGWIDASAKM